MPMSSDPTETADIGDLEQRHTAQANHLERIAKMAAPFGYSLVDNAALEHLRSEADAARTMRRVIGRHAAELELAGYDIRPSALLLATGELVDATAMSTQPDPPAAA